MEMKFTEDNFEAEALESSKVVMVDFYADWCGPCKMMAPVVEELAEQYEGQAVIGKLNVDEAQSIARRYKVLSIPTLLFLKDGEEAGRIVGAVPKEELEEKLNSLL